MRKVICCAHRGAMAYAPQNTMKSFRLASEMGADMIELDVHMTKDGHAVVNHNPAFDLPGQPGGIIKEMTLSDVAAIRFQGEPIPTLEEVIRFCKECGMAMNIEVKTHTASEETVRLVKKYDVQSGTLISSFSRRALAIGKKSGPEIDTGYLTPPLLHPFSVGAARRLKCATINPNKTSLTSRFVSKAHAVDIRIFPWTVNNPDEMQRLIDIGVDGIITNKPDILNKIKNKSGVA